MTGGGTHTSLRAPRAPSRRTTATLTLTSLALIAAGWAATGFWERAAPKPRGRAEASNRG